MKLPAEWARVTKEVEAVFAEDTMFDRWDVVNATRSAVERCYALHSKPKKELTDAEIDVLWLTRYDSINTFARAVIAAHEAKQREPETVTFRAALFRFTGRVDMLNTQIEHGEGWEWLEPPQTFEVVLP